MENKEIICVYQDCPLCGDRGRKMKKLIFDKKLNVRKVSFASDEGRRLISTALFDCGIGSLPFYTDGVRFSTNLGDFVVKKTTKRKTTKTKKGDKK